MKKTPYKTKTKTALGSYIQRFLNDRGISYKDFTYQSGISLNTYKSILYSKNRYIHLQNYFKIADFMVQNSNLPIGFYLRRLKEHIENGIKIKTRQERIEE